MACQDWSNTKAAYRFFSNENVEEEDILSGHFESTMLRAQSMTGYRLVLHDTTEFSFQRKSPDEVGFTHKLNTGKRDRSGLPQHRTKCGLLMHSSLVVTEEGLPLGLGAVKFWTRKKFKGSNQLRKKVCFTRIPIEEKESYRWLSCLEDSSVLLGDRPERCVHIGDREADILELFCQAKHLGTHFLVRSCTDRNTDKGKMVEVMNKAKVRGQYKLQVTDRKGRISWTKIKISFRRVNILPSPGKQKLFQPQEVTVIVAKEQECPTDREPIHWRLLTDLPVKTRLDALEKIQWYALRWRTETFHKILKSGCKAEDSKLRTADRLTRFISLLCILSWRIFWMTMIKRVSENSPANVVFTDLEISLLDQLVSKESNKKRKSKTLSEHILRLAQLGGYLARAKDPPPGNQVIWRGMSRLTDIQLGFEMGRSFVGN